jgi:hypothetical protein
VRADSHDGPFYGHVDVAARVADEEAAASLEATRDTLKRA